MAQINNSDLSRELVAGAKIQQNVDAIPSQLADKVVPVMEVNPKLLRRITFLASSTSSGTIYTAAVDRDTFLMGVSIAASNKTASQDSAATVAVQPKGTTSTIICGVNFSTSAILDVQQANQVVNFTYPLLIEKGSVVSVAVSNINSKRACVWGYTVENSNA